MNSGGYDFIATWNSLSPDLHHPVLKVSTPRGEVPFADKGYQGAGGSIRTPFKGHRLRPPLSRHQRSVNRAHARIRACGERAVATLKTWKVLTRLRCCPHRATTIVQAILVLQLIEEGRYSG
ncbi:hypothetical protein GCM10023096_39800 [Nonomuraea ferruginea]